MYGTRARPHLTSSAGEQTADDDISSSSSRSSQGGRLDSNGRGGGSAKVGHSGHRKWKTLTLAARTCSRLLASELASNSFAGATRWLVGRAIKRCKCRAGVRPRGRVSVFISPVTITVMVALLAGSLAFRDSRWLASERASERMSSYSLGAIGQLNAANSGRSIALGAAMGGAPAHKWCE